MLSRALVASCRKSLATTAYQGTRALSSASAICSSAESSPSQPKRRGGESDMYAMKPLGKRMMSPEAKALHDA